MTITRISTLAASVLTGLALVAAPAHAFDGRWINFGIGAAQQLNGMAQRAQAAERRRQAQYQEQMRRYHLSQSKAGRRRLTQEDRAARAQEQRNMRIMQGVIGAAVGGMLGGGGGGGAESMSERNGRLWRERYPSTPGPEHAYR